MVNIKHSISNRANDLARGVYLYNYNNIMYPNVKIISVVLGSNLLLKVKRAIPNYQYFGNGRSHNIHATY